MVAPSEPPPLATYTPEEKRLVGWYVRESAKPTQQNLVLPLVRAALNTGWTLAQLGDAVRDYFQATERKYRVNALKFFAPDVLGDPPQAAPHLGLRKLVL
jgi:hypothetical protein